MTQPARNQLRRTAGLLALAGIAGALAPAASARASAPVPILTAIHAKHHHGYDQLVFQFAGRLPAHRGASYLARLPASGSAGSPGVVGQAVLRVSFSPASGHDSQGLVAYGPSRRSYALPELIQLAAQGSNGALGFLVGMARRMPFHVRVLPSKSRVVINVRTPRRIIRIPDYFIDSAAAPGQAVTVPVLRPVIRRASTSSALQRLFAGPTQAELGSGLRFIASGATGFSRLTIRRGVARVHLTGSCSGGGSTVTVATEIMPTLRQLSSVRWVKIYDPAGRTTRPGGRIDSIPACLRPSALRLWAGRHKGLAISMLVVALIIAGCGILLGLMLSALSVLAGLALRPDLITPAGYRAERVKANPVGPGLFEPDLAWPCYPFRQVRADLSRIEADRRSRYRKLWHWPGKPIIWILLLPVTLAAVSCLLVAGLTTLVLAGLVALVTWGIAAVTAAALAATAVLLRGAEWSWHKVMRTDASCPQCYHVTPRPAYRCPGCSALHRDVRPGRLGVVTRRCECGTLLPTMVLRAARRLEAVCQRCETPLRAGSAALRDVRIPIFGDTSAGKTRFLYAGLDSLIHTTSRAGIAFGFPDEDSQSQATAGLDLIRSGQDTVKTSATLPTALTCRVGTGPRSTLVHLFDAAGEDFRGAQMHDALGFLDNGHGLVYVLDPFSIGSVRDRMAGQHAEAIRLAHAAAGDPEIAYGEVISRLRDSGVAAEGQRLAIVVSKVDLLDKGGLKLPGDSDAIAAWLMEAGVHNLVLSVKREFAEARYFAVASLAATETSRRHDPGAPLRWLLSSRGVRLPAEPPAARSRRVPRSSSGPADQAGSEQDETAKVRP